MLLAREKQLDQIRSAFFPPGQSHRPFGKVRRSDFRVASPQGHEYDLIAKQVSRCEHKSDYVLLIKSILAQKTASHDYHTEGSHLICDFLYQRLKPTPAFGIDTRVLKLVNHIRYRMEDAKVALPESLVAMGLLSAVHSRSFPALRVWLAEHAKSKRPMATHLFNELAESLSRPQRHIATPNVWSRLWTQEHTNTALRALAEYVPRDSHGLAKWLRVLGRVNRVDWMRSEWHIWAASDERLSPFPLPCPVVTRGATTTPLQLHQEGLWNTKARGDLLFIEAFAKGGAIKEAWKVLENSNVLFHLLKPVIKKAMMAHPQFAAPNLWTEEMKDELKGKLLDECAAELAKIEVECHVKWVWDEEEGMGYHRPCSIRDDDG